MRRKQTSEFDIISAAWVFACNDENPIITYIGVIDRLGLEENADVKSVINKRAELFRKGLPKKRLEAWKAEMLKGKKLPSWIINIPKQEREATIRNLQAADVFRSQFRAEEGAKQSSIELIEWGLIHIDRLRKSKLEEQDNNRRNWEVSLLITLGILNLLATVFK